MKLYRGLPPKKYILELCEKHDLVIRSLDTYSSRGALNFNPRDDANEKAEKVIKELEEHGFTVSFREAKKELALTGEILIERKGTTMNQHDQMQEENK